MKCLLACQGRHHRNQTLIIRVRLMYSLLMYFSVCQLFNFCAFWYYLIIKLNVPQVLSNRLNIFTIVITSIPPTTHLLCVCVCVCLCVRVIYASHSILIAIYENNAFDLTATLNKPLFKQNNLPPFDFDDNCILFCAA